MKNIRSVLLALLALMAPAGKAPAQSLPPAITNYVFTNGLLSIQFTPHPSAQAYYLLTNTSVTTPFATNTNAVLDGFSLTGSASNSPIQFYLLQTVPMDSNKLVSALLLNRLAYGPTPDEVLRLASIGPQAYIDEQLAPETINEDVVNIHTNISVIESRFLGATDFINVVVSSNILYASTDFTVTNIQTAVSNNGAQLFIISSTTNIYTTNVATVTGFTNISVSSGNSANISDLRARHFLRAVGARRQLLEILLQFLENHFVTQYSKSSTYLNGFYNGDSGVREDRIATQWEFLENDRWRNALLDPNCTFYDLLRISCESPSMIVYLDTVNSRSDGSRIANENFGRELLELFTFGVDNGYDQNDITISSRSWAGWTIDVLSPTNALNPLSLPTTNRVVGALNGSKTNLSGVWAFYFKTNTANTTNKLGPIFPGKTVPARFGPPWAGQSYQLDILITNVNGTILTNKSVNSGLAQSNAIQAGYSIIRHLANQPFAMEFISIKLCRLFVHDNFPNPTTRTDLPEYAFYDYTNPNRSAEADLVHQCMVSWDTPGPDGRKGNVRSVLRTIFNSDLFRTNANMQKIKTPLEYTASALRALRANTNALQVVNMTNFTTRTDGYAVVGSGVSSAPGTAPLTRMGNMLLFERDAPDGYPEVAAPWISAGTLSERIRWIQSFCIASGQSGHTGSTNDAGNSTVDIVGLLKARLPSNSWTNAAAVADYFIGIIYPGEGPANLNQYRTAAINYLNDGSGDPTPSVTPFQNLTVSGTANTAYDNRVRGMVAMLFSFQRFQEQ